MNTRRKLLLLSLAVCARPAWAAPDAGSKASPAPAPATVKRLSYEQSVQLLQKEGVVPAGPLPPAPKARPRYGDPEPHGPSFFRMRVVDQRYENLSLPRTFFYRSLIERVSFINTDLSESTLCWNDFVAVDFSDAVLTKADLRASSFEKVKFDGASLRGADLRRSDFRNCSFNNADLKGAIAMRWQQRYLKISPAQAKQIEWNAEEGPEPEGG